ncbi:MAG: hypothetical protein AAFX99_34390 [Myxococcota bacterium]
MTTALIADHLPLPAIRVNDPLGAIDALDAVEAFVLAAVCLRVELGLARLDMATMRRLMVERGLRPAQLIVAGDRPLEMLNALGGPSPQYEALNAILTAAVLRYGSNLPESERPAWFTWIRFQLDRLAEQTPFRLVATLPEGLMLHPDARAQQAMLKQLHRSAAPEPSSPTSVLQALDAALAPLLPPPRPAPTAHLAILSQAPGNQVISVSRPVLPPPAHRDAIRREATLAVFDAVVGPLRLRRIPTPVKAPLESVELPQPRLVPVGLTRLDVEPVDVPESLTTIPTSPDPLPSLEPEPTPLAQLGIATAMLKSIEPGSDGQQHNTTQERDSEWAAPPLAEGIELPELLPELLELAEESRIQEEGDATPVPGREMLDERSIPAAAAMPDAPSSTLGVVSLSGEEGSRDVHVGYPVGELLKGEYSAFKDEYNADHDPHMDLRSPHTMPETSEAAPEVELSCAKPVLAGLGEHGVVGVDAPSGVGGVVLPVVCLPLDEAAHARGP